MRCPEISLRPMANDRDMTVKAVADFVFPLTRANVFVQNFVNVAEELLPFRYEIVATSFHQSPPTPWSSSQHGSRHGSGRNQDMIQHQWVP